MPHRILLQDHALNPYQLGVIKDHMEKKFSYTIKVDITSCLNNISNTLFNEYDYLLVNPTTPNKEPCCTHRLKIARNSGAKIYLMTTAPDAAHKKEPFTLQHITFCDVSEHEEDQIVALLEMAESDFRRSV